MNSPVTAIRKPIIKLQIFAFSKKNIRSKNGIGV
jgi:hypothetical protein